MDCTTTADTPRPPRILARYPYEYDGDWDCGCEVGEQCPPMYAKYTQVGGEVTYVYYSSDHWCKNARLDTKGNIPCASDN